ncbi:hypothetical protein M9434_006806 [Picochlorum sp. BPE23]|nr:hypothetical protein M9434_006806 [Picochlorum sp. BPE23]
MVSTRRRKSSDRRAAASQQREEYEDDIERYNREKNNDSSLDESDDGEDLSESEEEEEALPLGQAGSDSEDGGSSDLDSEEEIEKGTKYGQLLKQARAIKAKLDIARGEDEESESSEESSEEEDEEEQDGWGARKSAYYNADNIDMEGSEEEEDLQAEEEEARRLQKEAASRLQTEDYGEISSEEEEGSEDDLGDNVMQMEELDDDAKDLRAAAVRQDALELKALLQELRSSLSEIRGKLGPLLQEIKSGNIATSEGVSYLEAKHLLLLHYVACLVFYLLLKSEGKSVKDHPVIDRLIEIRSYLEKTRPIDKKLKYQIEKLLAAAELSRQPISGAQAEQIQNGDILSHKPRPVALVVDDEDNVKGSNVDKDGTYRPPRLNPISMELDEGDDIGPGRLSSKERRKQINASRKAARSSFIQDFAAEIAGAPEEKRMGAPVGMDTAEALRHRQKLAAREEVEEELMIRVPLSKDERKRLKAQRRAGLSGKALLDDFQDDIADLAADDLGIDPRFSRHKTNQRYGADLSDMYKKSLTSGDADIPERESLSSRRAKMDSIRAKRAISHPVEDQREARVGNEFYQATKRHIESQKKQRRDAMAPDELHPPLAEPVASGARKIDSAIEKNRGLTPHRRKDLKNPRKKHRIKFAEANVRRKGQVQSVKTGAAGAYGGESTGIKSKISKSVRF